jgi:hypothetical protein
MGKWKDLKVRTVGDLRKALRSPDPEIRKKAENLASRLYDNYLREEKSKQQADPERRKLLDEIDRLTS